MYHSAIGNIQAYIFTIQCTDNPAAIKVAANRIKKEADDLIEAAEEIEGGVKNGRARSSGCRDQAPAGQADRRGH
jgi:hypothetical protein